MPDADRAAPVTYGPAGTSPVPALVARWAEVRVQIRSNSAASAARSRTSSPATLSRSVWPVGVTSPGW